MAVLELEKSIEVAPEEYSLVDGSANSTAKKEQDLQVDTTTIDSYSKKNCECVDLLKIDVEGKELKVIKGAEETIKKEKPNILVEIHPNYLKKEKVKPGYIAKKLDNMGYEIYKLGRSLEGDNKRKIEATEEFNPEYNITLYASKIRNKRNL
jgi:hypothetical protein